MDINIFPNLNALTDCAISCQHLLKAINQNQEIYFVNIPITRILSGDTWICWITYKILFQLQGKKTESKSEINLE